AYFRFVLRALRPPCLPLFPYTTLFRSLLDCAPADPAEPVRYPGWHEHRSIRERMRDGVPIDPELHAELTALAADAGVAPPRPMRSEEHTSELQSRENLVCRLLLEKKTK